MVTWLAAEPAEAAVPDRRSWGWGRAVEEPGRSEACSEACGRAVEEPGREEIQRCEWNMTSSRGVGGQSGGAVWSLERVEADSEQGKVHLMNIMGAW